MKTITSERAAKELPTILRNLTIEPVEITEQDSSSAVLITTKEYNDLKSSEIAEDRILWALAMYALNDGVLSDKDSEKFMEDLASFSPEWK